MYDYSVYSDGGKTHLFLAGKPHIFTALSGRYKLHPSNPSRLNWSSFRLKILVNNVKVINIALHLCIFRQR